MSHIRNSQNDGPIQDFNDAMKDIDLSCDDESIPTSTFSDMDDLFTTDSFDPERGNQSPGDHTLHKLSAFNKKSNRYSFCCICTRIVTPVVMISVLVVFSILFFGNSSSLQNLIPGLFESEDFGEQLVWRRSAGEVGGGLSLTVVNALDSTWHQYFDTAVQDWDTGSPDALTLSSQVASAPDPDCGIVEGVLKMCNSNFGETGWMGVNNVVKYDNLIAGSVGMMNEYYFGTGDDAKRQYTMCHEMGHGFGLSHTDTLLWNRNKRNCLDYTNRPKTNTRPGSINYQRLADVYGTVETNANEATTAGNSTASNNGESNASTPNPTSENPNSPNNGDENTGNNGQNKNDQMKSDENNEDGRSLVGKVPIFPVQFPPSVTKELDSLRQRQLSQKFVAGQMDHSSLEGWNRRLKRDGDLYGYELDVGNGYTIHVQYLKAY